MSSSAPIFEEPLTPLPIPEHGAAFIFLHGLDDDTHGWESKKYHHLGIELRKLKR